jgi:hypothetical protein
VKWTDPRHREFEGDLERMGYEVVEYHGRYHYHGPAVKVDASELQDVLRATDVRLVWDTLGKNGYVVYPDCPKRLGAEKDKLDFNRALADMGINWNEDNG